MFTMPKPRAQATMLEPEPTQVLPATPTPCYLSGLREGRYVFHPATVIRRGMPLCAACDATWKEGTDPASRKAESIARAAAAMAGFGSTGGGA